MRPHVQEDIYIYICVLTIQRGFSPQQTAKVWEGIFTSKVSLLWCEHLITTKFWGNVKKSSRKYHNVFWQILCSYRGMLGDKSSPKEVWNQRMLCCWSSAGFVRKLRNISSLCFLVAFQVWRLSTRCRHSCQEISGCLLRHAFRLFKAQTPACRGDSWRDWCLNLRLSRRRGSAQP